MLPGAGVLAGEPWLGDGGRSECLASFPRGRGLLSPWNQEQLGATPCVLGTLPMKAGGPASPLQWDPWVRGKEPP